ncbi:hypothetical protein SRHO_G00329260 [Serrasalmus rhombeus]
MGLAEEESPMMERPESVASGCSEDRYSVASGCSEDRYSVASGCSEGPFNFKAVEALKRGSSPAPSSCSLQSDCSREEPPSLGKWELDQREKKFELHKKKSTKALPPIYSSEAETSSEESSDSEEETDCSDEDDD